MTASGQIAAWSRHHLTAVLAALIHVAPAVISVSLHPVVGLSAHHQSHMDPHCSCSAQG